MTLIYLSPVNWDSIKQRPHFFIDWYHKKTQQNVIWIDPYPTRLPSLNDFKRFSSSRNDFLKNKKPLWLEVKKLKALPIEPLNFINSVNYLFWRKLIFQLKRDISEQDILIIGKPSKLAIDIAKQLNMKKKIYDAMDNFPYFYKGLSLISQKKNLETIFKKVDLVSTSSPNLANEYKKNNLKIIFVKNGGDFSNLPEINLNRSKVKPIIGYVGTIAKWIDWDWIKNLGLVANYSIIKIIGPLYVKIPNDLPSNVIIMPPISNKKALEAMNEFTIGIIPFKLTELTNHVDPIKFYEYKSLGLPVISTSFGSMAKRDADEGVFISNSVKDINSLVKKALKYKTKDNNLKEFLKNNSWEKSFDSSKIIEEIN